MKKQLFVAAAAAALVTVASPASATTCPMYTDPEFDMSPTGQVVYGFHDIVSVDAASDSTWLTGVVRFYELNSSPNAGLPGTTVTMKFEVNSRSIELKATYGPRGTVFEAYVHTAGWPTPTRVSVPATGVVDAANGEIRISVALADLTSYVSSGDTASAFHVVARDYRELPTGTNPVEVSGSDTAAGGAVTHTIGSGGCVTPGV